jgi:hypothetical protein
MHPVTQCDKTNAEALLKPLSFRWSKGYCRNKISAAMILAIWLFCPYCTVSIRRNAKFYCRKQFDDCELATVNFGI